MAGGREVRAGKAYVEIALRDRVQAGLRRMVTRLRTFGATVGAIGAGLTGAGVAIAGPLAFATKTFADFQDQMLAVRAVTGATGQAFEALNEQAKLLGRTTSFTAAQVAEGMLNLGRAGFSSSEIQSSISGVLSLARATGTDLAQSADIAAGTLRAFALEADQMGRVTDVLVATANNSAQTLEDLGESMKYVAPIAEEYGLSLEQTAKAVGVLANMQIKGSMAGTSLRQMMLRLANPQVQEQLQAMGVQALDAAGNLRPVGDILLDLGRAMQGMTNAERLAIGTELFDQRAAGAALKLAKSDFPALGQAIDNAGGVAQRTAEMMDSGVGGAFRRLMSAVEGAQIALGETLGKSIGSLMDEATALLGRITEWISANKQWVVGMVLAAAAMTAIGVALVAVGAVAATLAWTLGGLSIIWRGMTATAGILGRALIAPFSGAMRVVGMFRSGLQRLVSPLKAIPGLVGRLGTAFLPVGRAAVVAATRVATAVRRITVDVGRSISGMTSQVVQRVVSTVASSLPRLAGVGRSVFARMGQYARALAPMVSGAANAAFSRISTAAAPAIARVNAAWASLTQRMSAGWQAVSTRATTTWQAMSSRASIIWQQIQQRASASASRVSSAWTAVAESIGARWQRASARITGPFNAAMSRVQQIGRQAVSRVSAAWMRLPTWVRGPLAQVAGMARQDFGRVATAAMGAVGRIRAAWLTLGPALGRSLRTNMITAFAAVRSAGLATFARLRAAGSGIMSRIGTGVRGAGGRMAGAFGSLGSLAGILGASVGGPLAPLLMAAPLVMSALGAVGSALAALASPVGLVVAAIGVAVYAWYKFSDTGRAVVGGIGQALGELWATVKDVFGGISDALAAGDIRLAARILWSGLKVIFFQGVEQIRRLWPAISTAANQAWSYIRQAAGRLMDWLKGIWARLPAFITGPLSAVGSALGSLGAYLGAVFGDLFGQLGGIFRTMFGGLVKTISEGDWEAAGQIVMSGLEAAWLTGVAKLTQIWNDLKVAMIEAFAGVVIAVHRMWSGMVESLANSLLDLAAQDGAAGAVARKLIGVDMREENARAAQTETKRREVTKRNLEWTIGQWQQNLSVATEAGDTQEVERLTAAIAQAQKELAGLSGPLGSATEDAKRIVQDATQDAQDAVGAYWGGMAGDARQNADAAIDDARRAAEEARARLEQTAGTAEMPAGDGKSSLQKAREELDAALAEAKKKRDLFDTETAQEKVDEAGGGLGALPGAAGGAAGGEIQGTFNAMAIRGLGADSLAERTAKASEQIAQNTNQLVKEAQNGGLVFA